MPATKVLVRSQCGPDKSSVAVRPTVVQDSSPVPFVSPPPSHVTCVPVWPPVRPIWPPPQCMFASKCFGTAWVAVESVAARICREVGARLTTNVTLQDLDVFLPLRTDGRRLEVVADGLPLFDVAQFGKGGCGSGAGMGSGSSSFSACPFLEIVLSLSEVGRWPNSIPVFLDAFELTNHCPARGGRRNNTTHKGEGQKGGRRRGGNATLKGGGSETRVGKSRATPPSNIGAQKQRHRQRNAFHV